MVSLELR